MNAHGNQRHRGCKWYILLVHSRWTNKVPGCCNQFFAFIIIFKAPQTSNSSCHCSTNQLLLFLSTKNISWSKRKVLSRFHKQQRSCPHPQSRLPQTMGQSQLPSNSKRKVLSKFICPLTLNAMEDPMMTKQGHSYEKSAILTWLSKEDISLFLLRYLMLYPMMHLRIRLIHGVQTVECMKEVMMGNPQKVRPNSHQNTMMMMMMTMKMTTMMAMTEVHSIQVYLFS